MHLISTQTSKLVHNYQYFRKLPSFISRPILIFLNPACSYESLFTCYIQEHNLPSARKFILKQAMSICLDQLALIWYHQTHLEGVTVEKYELNHTHFHQG